MEPSTLQSNPVQIQQPPQPVYNSVPPVVPPITTTPQQKHTGLVINLILLAIILGLVGYIVYLKTHPVVINQVVYQETPRTVPNLANTVASPSSSPLTSLLPKNVTPTQATGTKTDSQAFPSIGITVRIPSGWTTKEDVSGSEKSLSITNGQFTLIVTKDPVITGGGVGFMYSGLFGKTGEAKQSTQSIVTMEKIMMKVTNAISSNAFQRDMGTKIASGTAEIFGGSVITNQSGKGLPLIKESIPNAEVVYMIRYVYENSVKGIGMNDPTYLKVVPVMDAIAASIHML